MRGLPVDGLLVDSPRRRWPWVLVGALAVGLAAHGIAWWFVTGQILAGLPAFADQAAAAGWQIDAGAARRGGWPLAAAVRLPRVSVVRPLGGTNVRWTAEDVVVSVGIADPRALRVSAEGRQAVSFGDTAPLPFRAAQTLVRLPFAGAPATLEISELRTEGVQPQLAAAKVTGSVSGPVTFTVSAVQVTPPLRAPFEGGLTASGQIAVRPAIPALATPGASAAAWQQAGGQMEATSVAVDWGALHLTGHGGGGLDQQLQPAGRADLLVRGAPDLLAAAAAGGLVPAGPASAARAVLQLLSLAAKGGPVALPVVLAERRLVVAGFPLLVLPVVQWDAR